MMGELYNGIAPENAGPVARAGGTTPFLDDYLSYLLSQASALVSARLTAELKRRRIALTTWRVLSALIDTDELSIGQLADLTLLAQPTLTRVVDRMSDQGLVERRHSDRDLRKVYVRVTPRGRGQITSLVHSAVGLEREALAGLPDEAVARLKTTLRTVIEHCSHRRPRANRVAPVTPWASDAKPSA